MRDTKHKGFALITVMLVLSVIAIMAMSLQVKQQQVVRRTGMMVERARAYEQLRGAEDYAKAALGNTFMNTPQLIYNDQVWNHLDQIPLTNNSGLSIEVRDMQGSFNINTLLGGNVSSAKQFQAMCKYFQFSEKSCESILSEFSSKNAEQNPQKKVVLEDIGQLAAFPGVEPADYAKMRQYMVALSDSRSAINVNTAPRELLQAILPEKTYTALDKSFSENGYISNNKLVELGLAGAGFTVGSNYFSVAGHAQTNGRVLTMVSLLANTSSDNSAPKIKILSREFIQGH